VTPEVVTAFATLLTPLAALAGVIYTMLLRRAKALEKQRDELRKYVFTTCLDRADSVEQLAAIILKDGE
jgi:hypothetical protein